MLAIAFAATNFKKQYNAAAILEWAVSFVFTFYVLSFVIDLAPAVHTHKGDFDDAEVQVKGVDNGRNF